MKLKNGDRIQFMRTFDITYQMADFVALCSDGIAVCGVDGSMMLIQPQHIMGVWRLYGKHQKRRAFYPTSADFKRWEFHKSDAPTFQEVCGDQEGRDGSNPDSD